MTTVSGSFTAVGVSSVLRVPERGDTVSVTISGTYDQEIYLERATGPDFSAWDVVRAWKVEDGTVAFNIETPRYNEIYRLNCKVDDGGTANYTMADTDKVLDEFKDSRGNVLMTVKESGVELPDNFTVTGDVAVTGDTVLTGQITLRQTAGDPIMTKVSAPSVSTTSTDMTETELLGGMHVKTPSAAQNWQVPTGTEISAALPSTPAVGDSFEFTVINLGGAADDITITVATGVTFVGDVVMRPVADAATDGTGSATWRFRNTAANVWVGYRIS